MTSRRPARILSASAAVGPSAAPTGSPSAPSGRSRFRQPHTAGADEGGYGDDVVGGNGVRDNVICRRYIFERCLGGPGGVSIL